MTLKKVTESHSNCMVPFESLGAVFYSPSILATAISLTVYEIFSVKESRDLENWVRGCSRSLKMAPFNRLHTALYWSAIVNIAHVQFLSYLTLNNIVTLKSGLEVTQDHSNWYHSKAWVRFPIPLA